MTIQDWLTRLLSYPATESLDWDTFSVTLSDATWKALGREIDATQAYDDGLDAGLRLLQATHHHRARLGERQYQANQILLYRSILATRQSRTVGRVPGSVGDHPEADDALPTPEDTVTLSFENITPENGVSAGLRSSQVFTRAAAFTAPAKLTTRSNPANNINPESGNHSIFLRTE